MRKRGKGTKNKRQEIKELKSVVIMPTYGSLSFKMRGKLDLPLTVERGSGEKLDKFRKRVQNNLAKIEKKIRSEVAKLSKSAVVVSGLWLKNNYKMKYIQHGFFA